MNAYTEYEQRYAKSREISVEEASTHMIPKEVKKYYATKEEEVHHDRTEESNTTLKCNCS